MITITDARITADLREATVFYTVLGDAAAQADTAAALESAKGLLRSTVGKALGLRHSPTLGVRPRRRAGPGQAHRRAARQRPQRRRRGAAARRRGALRGRRPAVPGRRRDGRADEADEAERRHGARRRVGERRSTGDRRRPAPGRRAPASARRTGRRRSRRCAALPPTARVLLVCHVNPDGDALGSMLGFGLGPAPARPHARCRRPSRGRSSVPEPFEGCPGSDLLVAGGATPTRRPIWWSASTRPASRGSASWPAGWPPRRVGIVLDHHASNPGFGDDQPGRPGGRGHVGGGRAAAGPARRAAGRRRSPSASTSALATDTGSFKFDATTPAVHELAARLLATGIRRR